MVLLIAAFVLGYLAIVFEHQLGLNKAASALLTGVACWTIFILGADPHTVGGSLAHHLGEVSGILFFLLGAMTIVELIDAHDGFELITTRITSTSRRKLLVSIAVIAFFLSAVLDNLTTSIVMMSLVRKLMKDDADRMYYGGVVIISANAGGAWSPIGDVTTTMLWVGGQITTTKVISSLIVPSVVSVIVPILWIGFRMRGNVTREAPQTSPEGLSRWLDEVERTIAERVARTRASFTNEAPELEDALAEAKERTPITVPEGAAAVGKTLGELNLRARTGIAVLTIRRDGARPAPPSPREPLRAGDALEVAGSAEDIARCVTLLYTNEFTKPTTAFERGLVFCAGVALLLFVPVFKTVTHLPPFMGILLALGVLWTLTEIIHKRKHEDEKGGLTVAGVLRRVDTQSVLFFLGILLAIGALQSSGLLAKLAGALDRGIGNVDLITMSIGLWSSVVDNVPLVAAAQGMYPLSTFPQDHRFWLFLAYCAGTGGSILIIGSAAGIAVMGIQRITFGWYVRHMSVPALLGYVSGALTYLGMEAVFPG